MKSAGSPSAAEMTSRGRWAEQSRRKDTATTTSRRRKTRPILSFAPAGGGRFSSASERSSTTKRRRRNTTTGGRKECHREPFIPTNAERNSCESDAGSENNPILKAKPEQQTTQPHETAEKLSLYALGEGRSPSFALVNSCTHRTDR